MSRDSLSFPFASSVQTCLVPSPPVHRLLPEFKRQIINLDHQGWFKELTRAYITYTITAPMLSHAVKLRQSARLSRKRTTRQWLPGYLLVVLLWLCVARARASQHQPTKRYWGL